MTGCDCGVYRPEDQEPTKWRFGEWPRRDTPLCAPLVQQSERDLDNYHPVMVFKDIECNTGTDIYNNYNKYNLETIYFMTVFLK